MRLLVDVPEGAVMRAAGHLVLQMLRSSLQLHLPSSGSLPQCTKFLGSGQCRGWKWRSRSQWTLPVISIHRVFQQSRLDAEERSHKPSMIHESIEITGGHHRSRETTWDHVAYKFLLMTKRLVMPGTKIRKEL